MEPRFIDERILGIKRRYFYPLVVLLAVGAGTALVFFPGAESPAPPAQPEVITQFEQEERVAPLQVGQPAPEIDLPVLAGPGAVALGREPVLIEFFASWCPHCQKMAAVIDRALKKVPVNFILIGAARESDQEVIAFHQNFLPEPMPGIVVNDPEVSVTEQYQISGYPTLFFIDAQGTIQSISAGERPEQEIVEQLRKIEG